MRHWGGRRYNVSSITSSADFSGTAECFALCSPANTMTMADKLPRCMSLESRANAFFKWFCTDSTSNAQHHRDV